ncbi:MAG TPA: hypothetical protein DCS49_00845 [Gammaproteobacteria bacterium]|nr:hypothetical protein [Gammaproteobacteria bacterium]
MARTEITIICPGLAPLVQREMNQVALPKALQDLLKAANYQQDNAGLKRLLCRLVTKEALTASDIPYAYLVTGRRDAVLIDFCILSADSDQLRLLPADIPLEREEKNHLIQYLLPLLRDYGEVVQYGNDWFLISPQIAKMRFTAIENVIGKSVMSFLPSGPYRQSWMKLCNDIQIELYQYYASVSTTGHTINSVWFWGAGHCHRDDKRVWDSVMSTQESVPILMPDTLVHPWTEQSSIPLTAGKHCIVLPECDVSANWADQLVQWERQLFWPLYQRLRWGRCRASLYVPHDGVYQLKIWPLWWQRMTCLFK